MSNLKRSQLKRSQLKSLPARPATLPVDLLAGWGRLLWAPPLGWLALFPAELRWALQRSQQDSLLEIR
jgi:hypothetical protein